MLLAVTVRERAFAQRLSQLGEDFNEFCEKPLAEMSEGQRKKFYLALAFSGDATLLILDEPTNHLDDAGRKTPAELEERLHEVGFSSIRTIRKKEEIHIIAYK